MAEGYAIIRATVARALETLRERRASQPFDPFDIILLDPPYEATGDAVMTLEKVLAAAGAVIALNGVLVLEHARKRQPPETAGRLARTREVIAGDSALAFYVCQR